MNTSTKNLSGRTPLFSLALLAIGILLLLSGCGNDSTAAKPEEPPQPKVQATRVTLQQVIRQDLQENFTLPGTLEAWDDLTLAAEYAGPIVWTGPDEGDRLQAGEAILSIDTDTAKANLQRDQTAYEVQQRELERYRKLLEGQMVSQQEFDSVKSRYETANTALRQSKLALAKSTLKSPVAGVLDRLLVDRGEYVSPGDPLAQVVRIDKLKVIVEVPEKDVGYLLPGQQIAVLPAGLNGNNGEELTGEILHVGYRADPASRTYRVKLGIDNPGDKLRPGMILRARFVRQDHPDTIAIPLYALIDQEGKKVVFIEENGIARRRSVEIGAVIGSEILVTAGLNDGDQLVVKGQQLLTDGAKVESQMAGSR